MKSLLLLLFFELFLKIFLYILNNFMIFESKYPYSDQGAVGGYLGKEINCPFGRFYVYVGPSNHTHSNTATCQRVYEQVFKCCG